MIYSDFVKILEKINFNRDLSIEKGLIKDNNYQWYYQIFNLYMNIFKRYLQEKLNFNFIKEDFIKSNLFYPIQNNEIIGIAITNFFFIEKLSISDINILKNHIDKKNVETPILYNLISSTYQNVIKNNFINNKYLEDKIKIVVDYDNLNNYVDNDSLVIRITYNGETKLEDKENFITVIKNRRIFLNKEKKIIEDKFNPIIKTHIIYNEIFK